MNTAMQKALDRLCLIPVFGLCGAGKTECMDSLAAAGHQVLSVEIVAGVRGVCIAGATGESVISQRQFDAALADAVRGLDCRRPVWVEWKSAHVTGLTVPNCFVERVRASPALYIDVPLHERVERLLSDYAPWAPHYDLLLAKFVDRGLSGPVVSRLAGLVSEQRSFIQLLLSAWLDVEYRREAGLMTLTFGGRFLPGAMPSIARTYGEHELFASTDDLRDVPQV